MQTFHEVSRCLSLFSVARQKIITVAHYSNSNNNNIKDLMLLLHYVNFKNKLWPFPKKSLRSKADILSLLLAVRILHAWPDRA